MSPISFRPPCNCTIVEKLLIFFKTSDSDEFNRFPEASSEADLELFVEYPSLYENHGFRLKYAFFVFLFLSCNAIVTASSLPPLSTEDSVRRSGASCLRDVLNERVALSLALYLYVTDASVSMPGIREVL